MKQDERPLTEDERRLGELVRATLGDSAVRPFVPFALYDRGMDRLVIVSRDCSICEHGVLGVLTMFEDNHPEEGEDKYVGFAIEMFRTACNGLYGKFPERIDLKDFLVVAQIQFPEIAKYMSTIQKVIATLPSSEVNISWQ